MNIARRIVEEKKIIVTYDLVFDGEIASLNFIAELGGRYGDSFSARFNLYTAENDYSGCNRSFDFWSVYNKETDSDYTYGIKRDIKELVKDECARLKAELTGVAA